MTQLNSVKKKMGQKQKPGMQLFRLLSWAAGEQWLVLRAKLCVLLMNGIGEMSGAGQASTLGFWLE